MQYKILPYIFCFSNVSKHFLNGSNLHDLSNAQCDKTTKMEGPDSLNQTINNNDISEPYNREGKIAFAPFFRTQWKPLRASEVSA